MTNVLLDSGEGKERLAKCIGREHAISSIDVWEQQSGRTLCSFQSLACMINSVHQTRKKDVEIFQTVLQQHQSLGICESSVLAEGVTMDEFVRIANSLNSTRSQVNIMHTYCGEVGDSGRRKDEVKQSIIATLAEQNYARIACNYHMSTAGQEPYGGHFSPLVAFHEESDSFLILDVWPDTAPFWIQWEKLWEAMVHMDTKSGRSRGVVFIDWGSNNVSG